MGQNKFLQLPNYCIFKDQNQTDPNFNYFFKLNIKHALI